MRRTSTGFGLGKPLIVTFLSIGSLAINAKFIDELSLGLRETSWVRMYWSNCCRYERTVSFRNGYGGLFHGRGRRGAGDLKWRGKK